MTMLRLEHDLMRQCVDDMQKLVDANPEGKLDLAVRLKQLRQVIDDTYKPLLIHEKQMKIRRN